MTTPAQSAQGTKFYLGSSGSPNDYSAIPGIVGYNGPSGQANLIDVTDLDSTGKEYLIGLKDEGEITLDINWAVDNTVHKALRAAYSARTLKTLAIDFTDTAPVTRWEADIYVTSCQITGGVDAAVKASVTLKITGAIREQNQ